MSLQKRSQELHQICNPYHLTGMPRDPLLSFCRRKEVQLQIWVRLRIRTFLSSRPRNCTMRSPTCLIRGTQRWVSSSVRQSFRMSSRGPQTSKTNSSQNKQLTTPSIILKSTPKKKSTQKRRLMSSTLRLETKSCSTSSS